MKNAFLFPSSPVNYHKKRLALLCLVLINLGLHLIYGSLAGVISEDYGQDYVPALVSASLVYIILHVVGLVATFLEHHIWLKVYAKLCFLMGASSIIFMILTDLSSLYWFVPVLSYITAIMALAFILEVDAVRARSRPPPLNSFVTVQLEKTKSYGTTRSGEQADRVV